MMQWGDNLNATVSVKYNPWSLIGLGLPVSVDVATTGAAPFGPWFLDSDLLELKWYGAAAPPITILRSKCVAAMAYGDYFPDKPERGRCLRCLISAAVTQASPGWCGTFGPDVTDLIAEALGNLEGNYDMSQMSMIPLAYLYYDFLSPNARTHIVTELLAHGQIRRPGLDDSVTSGPLQEQWRTAGTLEQGETENHILMILTTRYLTNQLLYQRSPDSSTDNRRNATDDQPSCLQALLYLLGNILVADFSEYNAKSYQEETRWPLVNLCTFAYDHEIRLASQMALDYISAHIAISSQDLRRLVPFRRRNVPPNQSHSDQGFMTVGLLDGEIGADPMVSYFAL
jgi:hypothetical protein